MVQLKGRVLGLIWVVLLAIAGWQLPDTRWQSSILSFLPEQGQVQGEADERSALHRNPANQHIRLLLTGGDTESYEAFAAKVQTQAQGVQWLDPVAESQTLQRSYRAFSGVLVSAKDYQRLVAEDYQSLIAQAWRQLSSPMPATVSDFRTDPLLLTENFAEPGNETFFDIRPQGFVVSQEPLTWLMIGAVEGDGFDRDSSASVVTAVAEAAEQMQQRNSAARVSLSGVPFHTAEAASNAEWEINTFGTLSLIGVIGLLWFSFGHLKPLALALTVLGVAASTGFAVVVVLFDTVHLIALVFATTLVGIAVDYAIHGALAAGHGERAFRHMLPHLRIGVLTTVAGYIAMGLLPFALLQQVAVFIGSGIVAAYLVVHLVIAKFTDHRALQVKPCVERAATKYHRRWQAIRPPVAQRLALGLGVVAVALSTLLQFDDDVSRLTQSSSSLLADEQRVHQALQTSNTVSHWLVQQATDVQQLLEDQEQLREQLRSTSAVKGWQMVADNLPSIARQQRAQSALQGLWRSDSGENYLAELGLTAPPPRSEWLELDQLSPWLQTSLQYDGSNWVSFIEIKSHQAWGSDALNLPPTIQQFTPLGDARHALGNLRQLLYLWLSVALGLAFIVLAWKRGWRVAVCGTAYLAFVLIGALSMSQWLTGALHVFHLVAVILVLGLAIDYLVFFSSPLHASAMHIAVNLSAITSLLAFGLLALSGTPAIASFGLTVAVGILLAAMLGPLFTRLRMPGDLCS